MFVFLDESGDAAVPGMKPYFALAALAFETADSRDEMEEALKQLRHNWGKKLNFEFKFIWLSEDERLKFFQRVGDLAFKHVGCVLQKDGISGQWTKKRYLYERVIREVVDGLKPYFRSVAVARDKPLRVRVTFDEHTDPDYSRLLKEQFGTLHAQDGSRMVPKQNVKPGKSKTSSLIQLADMLCGAIRWDTNIYRKYVSAQCLRLSALP